MRFIHTGDWHLGRVFHQMQLIEDQAYVLDQFVALVSEEKPDVVLISGDVYDRAVPPTDAVNLLNDVLSRLILGCGTQVIMVTGNHDSPDRLQFGSDILAKGGLHVCGQCCAQPYCATVADEYGPVQFYAVPFTDPARGRELFGDEGIRSQQSLMAEACRRIISDNGGNGRSVVLAHTYVAGASSSESERPLSMGGVDEVDPTVFSGFSYVALGHLHCPQAAAPNAFYAGSILKYSFGEGKQVKSVNLIEMDSSGKCKAEAVRLSARRDVRVIEGELEVILANPACYGCADDYLQIILHDRQAILDPMGKLREVFPNVLDIQRPVFLSAISPASGGFRPGKDGRSALDYFDAFYKEITSQQMSDQEKEAFSGVLEKMEACDREVAGQ